MHWEKIMSDFDVLTAVRGYLLHEKVASHVHLALPPRASYPLVLLELEEIWSSYPLKGNGHDKDCQTRVKFRVGVYSQSPAMQETVHLSGRIKKVLEGAAFSLPNGMGGAKQLTIRFLACVAATNEKAAAGQQISSIHHFYDCLVRG
jgi:hypothetical protein